MKRHAVAVIAAAVGLVAAGCTADEPSKPDDPGSRPAAAGEFRLVSYPNCDAALEGLRTAARANVQAWGSRHVPFSGDAVGGTRADAAEAAPNTARDSAGAKAAPGETYSGTNNHEAGVDEPDLVKTDGKRIITVQGGVLRVVDAATRAQTARVTVTTDRSGGYEMGELLISGDKVLLIGSRYGYYPTRGEPAVPQLTLIDLAGTPRVLGRFGMNGSVVDARQVGSTVRVVMRSNPEIERPADSGTPEAYRLALINSINRAAVTDWLPRYTIDNGGTVTTGQVDCSAVAHPAEFTAATMLTVLSFDLTKSTMGNGDPVTVAADGDTVYSNGPSLYVANDQRWRSLARTEGGGVEGQQRTEIYKFDTSKPGRPAFVAGGAVDGWLLNQYSMSDWNGHLRVATTTGTAVWGRPNGTSESTVYALRQDGRKLSTVGKVGGLGKGERIYSVRFVGPTGYVVTFRQTDPLYTVDLRDPTKPAVTGELKITGYSAYLHPAGDGLLLGIGQEANEQGRVQGTQISLFDVRDPARPTRLAQYHVKGAYSEAEFDPHAFLYWPATGLLVVPLNGRTRDTEGKDGALALKVSGNSISELGLIQQPVTDNGYPTEIRRSLFINGTLWTVSPRGLLASDAGTTAQQAWVPFT
jgi:uncharacterized secreted protein with C-terminal beta-propeller domain